jgi:hypothetical protein
VDSTVSIISSSPHTLSPGATVDARLGTVTERDPPVMPGEGLDSPAPGGPPVSTITDPIEGLQIKDAENPPELPPRPSRRPNESHPHEWNSSGHPPGSFLDGEKRKGNAVSYTRLNRRRTSFILGTDSKAGLCYAQEELHSYGPPLLFLYCQVHFSTAGCKAWRVCARVPCCVTSIRPLTTLMRIMR